MSQVSDVKGLEQAIKGVKLPGQKHNLRQKKAVTQAFTTPPPGPTPPPPQPPQHKIGGAATTMTEEEMIQAGLIADPKLVLTEQEMIDNNVLSKPSAIEAMWNKFFGRSFPDDPAPGARLTLGVSSGIAGAQSAINIASKIPIPPVGPYGLAAKAGIITLSGITGGVVGTIAGNSAPETLQEMLDYIGATPRGFQGDPETFSFREEWGLSASDLKALVEQEVMIEMAGNTFLAGIRGVGRVVARFTTGMNAKTRWLAERAAKEGIHLMPVQVGDGVVARMFVVVGGRFPFLGGALRRQGKVAGEELERLVKDLPANIAQLFSVSDMNIQILRRANVMVKAQNRYFKRKYRAIYQRADDLAAAGTPVVVNPNFGIEAAQKALKDVQDRIPAMRTANPSAGPVLDKLRKFLDDEILGMMGKFDAKDAAAAKKMGINYDHFRTQGQSLKQIDGLLEKIDQEIAALEPKDMKFAIKHLVSVKTALQKDFSHNIVGKDALKIGEDLRALDIEYSQTWQQLFDTTAAKRFQTVQKGGLGKFAIDKTTRIPVDKLGKNLIDMESPMAIEQLSRLVGAKTMNRIFAQSMDQAMSQAMKEVDGLVTLNSHIFKKQFGIGLPRSARYAATKQLLMEVGGHMTMKDLEELAVVFRAMEKLEIPNASTFLSRRAGIAGIRGVIGGIVPGATIATAAPGFASGMVMMLGFYGGAKLFAAAISNPLSARALKAVMKEETTAVNKRKAMIGGIRIAMEIALGDGNMTQMVYDKLIETVPFVVDLFFKQMKDDFGTNIGMGTIHTDTGTFTMEGIGKDFDAVMNLEKTAP